VFVEFGCVVAAQVAVDDAVGGAASARDAVGVHVVFMPQVALAVAGRARGVAQLVDAVDESAEGVLDLPLDRVGPAVGVADEQPVRGLLLDSCSRSSV